MEISKNDRATPYVDDIYKERNRLKQKQIDIQNTIKDAIDSTDTQIRKLRNKLDVLENKKKTLIIEYNKECSTNDRIRGTTPPRSIKVNSGSLNRVIPMSPKTELINNQTKEIENIKKELEGNKFKKIIETMMENKLSTIKTRIKKNENASSNICDIM